MRFGKRKTYVQEAKRLWKQPSPAAVGEGRRGGFAFHAEFDYDKDNGAAGFAAGAFRKRALSVSREGALLTFMEV